MPSIAHFFRKGRRFPRLIGVVLFVMLASFAFGAANAQVRSADRKLHDAWALAERAGQYRFTSQVDQTTIPAPRLANVGQAARQNHLTVQGAINRERDTLQLALWDNPATAFDPQTALEVLIEDGVARGRAAGGEWQTLEGFTDAFAPGGDVAAYLLAARHVTDLGRERRELPALGAALTIQRYHFAVDGPALAAYLTEQLAAEMRRKGELPPGMRLDFGNTFRQIAGSGEAWLDEDGLPLRLQVALEFPQQANGERVLVKVRTDFTEFDRTRLLLSTAGFTTRLAAAADDLRRGIPWRQAADTAAVLLALAGAILFLGRLPHRRAQAIVSVVVLASMLIVPIAQAAPPSLPSRLTAAAARPQEGGGDKKPPPGPEIAFDSTRDPLAGAAAQPLSQPGRYSLAANDSVFDGPDADRDGLPDALEAPWGTGVNTPDSDGDGLLDGEEVRRCPDRGIGLAGGKLAGINATWASCANPKVADTDGDGLTDNQEVVFLGTSPNDKDSDGDGLSDAVEARGFTHAGVTRYTNLLSPDTDADGLLDGDECPGGVCRDSDGQGEPDVFEIDNDGDGFIGAFDLAPYTVLGKSAPFNRANPFQLGLVNLSAGKSVLVDFQVRPTNANHIGFGQSVLDWPTGDTQGQIQRRLDSTFADANPLPANMAAPNPYPQSYGDMRLAPMLEIEMSGSAAPLPRTAATQTVTFRSAPLLAVVQIVKQTEDVTLFGFTVSEPEDLRIRVKQLSREYTNFSLEIHKATCASALNAPVYTAANLVEAGEVTLSGAELATIADGSHVALLKATGLSPARCVPIDAVKEGVTQMPLSFQLAVQPVGSLTMQQVGSAVQLNVRLPNRTGAHDLVIYEGSCQSRQAVVTTLPVAANGATTLPSRNLVDLADGKHSAVIKQGAQALACSSLGNIVNGPAGETRMIDHVALGKLGITVSEADDAGALVAHVPLQVAQDRKTGVMAGLAGTMLYDTTAATGWQHRVRVSWWVQVLTDRCAAPPADFMAGQGEQARLKAWCGADGNLMQLVHVYDENWQLAGLSVREEHDFDMAVIFEDPASDNDKNSDDYLWHLARGLDEQFVTGVDCVRANGADGCGSDNQRDYTLDTLYNTFDKRANAAVSDTDRWGLPQATFRVEKFAAQLNTYLDQGQMMQTHVPALLKTHFLENGKPRAVAPVLLFAGESKFRSLALGNADYVAIGANGATVDFDPANQDAQTVLTLASLNWAPYRYDTANQSWQSYPFAEYWDLLATRLRTGRDFSATADPDGRAIAAGKVLLAQTYYTYLYNGRAALVQSGDTVIGQYDINAGDYVSRAERAAWVLDAGELATQIANGGLINQVIQPFVESLVDNFNSYQFQRALMQREGTARILGKVLNATDAVADNTSVSKMWANIGGDTRSSLVESFFGNFRSGSLSRVGGWKMSVGATGLALGALAAGVAGSIYAATQDDGANTVQQVLNGVILAVSIAGAVGMLAKASQAIEDGAQGIAKIVAAAAAPAGRAGQIAGVVGLIIGELVNYGLLIAQIAISSLTVGGLIANQLAAQSIASSVTAGMMFALASTGIGAIVVAIIGLIDGLIFLICGFLDEDQTDSTTGQIFCTGISGWLTQLVSFFIYAQNEITRVGDPYRLNYLAFNPGLGNPAAGFTPGAAVSLTLAVRNTLALAHLPVNIGIFYWHQFNADALQSARFAYDIVAAEPGEDATEIHDSLTRGAGANPWAVLERDADGNIVTVYDDTAVANSAPMALTLAAGLNRKVPAFLAEGYAVPVQECVSNATFLFPLPPVVVCWVRSRGATNYNDLNLAFDVLPATLDEFYRLEPAGAQPGRVRQAWANNPSLPFPALMDADGDGLRYDADRDDTRWDTDGDGLSDAVEQARGADPGNRDSDEDGLTDVQEQMWRTDPLSADSDGDGLSDGDEVRGWAIGYGVAANGSVLPGWTYSDPLKRDSDKDAILDAQERVYGFNPNVANDPTVLIYEAQVTEPESPLLLTRFEERTGATTFSDAASAAGGNIAACKSESCPTAGHRGRFGNAVHFNGTDQFLTIPPNKAIGDLRTNISLSAWVKPSKLTGQQAVIHIGPGGANGVGGLTFGLSGDDLYVQFEGLGAAGLRVQPLAAGVIALDQWSHIAVEIYGNTGQLYFDANGVLIGEQTGLVKTISANPEIIIGAAQQPASNVAPGKDGTIPNVQVNHFAGLLDEALIQGWAPDTQRSIQALFAGRYNPNDTILRPGQAVAYESTLENALLARAIFGRRQINYAPGLTEKAAEVKPFALEPARAASFSEAFTVRAALASGPYTLTQSVDATVSIPARDMWKDPAGDKVYDWPGPQIYAGTSNTVSDSNQPVDLRNTSFTIAAWIKPTHSDTARRGILGRNSGQVDAFPYLLTEGRKLKFGFGTGAALVEVAANGGADVLSLNQWNFVAVRYDLTGTQGGARSATFFLNGVKLNSAALNAQPSTAAAAFKTFFVGRASNLGKVALNEFNLTCEGDPFNDGDYDIIAAGQNLQGGHLTGSDPRVWPLAINRTFNDSYTITVCEDDNDTNNVCEGSDENMGSLTLSSDAPTQSGAKVFANPTGKTECAYDWGRASYPDIAALSYSFTNDSLPFMGELRNIEIHRAALSDVEIRNIAAHGDKVAQFRLDEIPGATQFKDYIAYHQLNCAGTRCPQTGLDGPQNVSVLFDGLDDTLEEGGVHIDDTISADIGKSNTKGFALSVWINPTKPAGITQFAVTNIATFQTASGSKGELNLSHTTAPSEGYFLFYKDVETGNPFSSQIGGCFAAFDDVHRYGDWTHVSISMDAARQTANLYVGGRRCQTPSIPLRATYVPKRGDLFYVGRSPANPTYRPFMGNMDDLHIHRRPLTQPEETGLYRQGKYRHWDLDEPEAAPTTPVKGLMRQALQFRQFADRYFVVDDRADIYYYDGDTDRDPATPNPITFALWVKAEDLAGRKRPLLSIQTNPFDGGPKTTDFMLYLEDGTPKIRYYQSNTGAQQVGAANKKVSENVWQHLVFRKDDTGKMAIFINGYKASDIATNWDYSDVRKAGGMALAADLTDSSFYRGQIDELIVYRAALTDQEVRELYNYQNAWVDETVKNAVTVDADAPTSALQLKTTYLADAPQYLQISTVETTTQVIHAELGVDAGAGIRWTGAAAASTDAAGNTWLPWFEPAGDGAYRLYSRATDKVGNTETPGAGQLVYVDGRPPVITFNAVAALVRPTASESEAAVWTVYLDGASGDPPIQETSQPGSGIETITVQLFERNAQVATLLDTQRATLDPATGAWSVYYRLNAANPTGEYDATAIATDRVGNQTAARPMRIRIDTTAPEAHVTILTAPAAQQMAAAAAQAAGVEAAAASAYPGVLGADSAIGGIVTETPDDVVAQTQVAGVDRVEIAFAPLFAHGSTFRNQPLPATTRLYLPLDESSRTASGDRSFADVSPARQRPLICAGAACPAAGAAGRAGQALAFDGVDDSLTLTNTATLNGLTNDFTIAAWIKPDSLPVFSRIVSVARTHSADGFGFGTRGSGLLMTTYGIKDYRSKPDLLTPGVWQHVAVYFSANNAAEFYVNGLLVETVPGDAPAQADTDDRLLIGATTEPGSAATSQHFDGAIDEVVITRSRIAAADWDTLFGMGPTLHLPFDEPFLHPNAKLSNAAGLAIRDAVYLSSVLPADRNLRDTGKVGAGALRVNATEGALIGGAAPGVLPHQNGPFSLAFWADLADDDALAAFWIGRSEGTQNRVLVRTASATVQFTGKTDLVVAMPNLAGDWHHLLLTYNGSVRILYLDGREVGRDTITPNMLDTASGGMFVAGGTGRLDDLRVYKYALNAREAQALAKMGWQAAGMVTAAAGQSKPSAETTWSAGVPAGLEGFYELQSRGADALGNVDAEPEEVVTWRGLVDSLAPRVLNFTWTPAASSITFTLTVEDFALSADTITMPAGCTAGNTTRTVKLYESPWYLASAAQAATLAQADQIKNRTYQLTLQCRASFAVTNDTFTVCDLGGNCTQAKYTGPGVGTPIQKVYLPLVKRK